MCEMTRMAIAGDLRSRIRAFLAGESGAVTVDWVVLTGAVVGLCIAMFATVNTGIYTMGEVIGDGLSGTEIKDLGTVNDW